MTDNEIIALFNARCEDAIAESQKAYGKYCSSIACGILENEHDAEECVNDTWLRAWNSIPPASPASLKSYLGTITRNLSLDRLRTGRNTEKCADVDDMADVLPDPSSVEDEAITDEVRGYVNEWLGTLDKNRRDVFVCRYYFCASNADIASSFGMEENRVRSILSKLRKKLAKYLKERGFEV